MSRERKKRGFACLRSTAVVLLVALMMIPLTLFGVPLATNAQTVVKTIAVPERPFGIAVNKVTNKVYIGEATTKSVFVVDGATDSVIKSIPVPAGVGTGRIAVNEVTNKVYVPVSYNNAVSVIDGQTDAVVKTIAVGEFPVDVGVNPQTNKVYVANEHGSSVTVIDGNTDTVSKSVALGRGQFALCVNPLTNKVYVKSPPVVFKLDGGTDTIELTREVPDLIADGIGINQDENLLYAMTWYGVTILDGVTCDRVTFCVVAGTPFVRAVSRTTGRVYSLLPGSKYYRGSVEVMEASGRLVASVPTEYQTTDLAVNSSTNKIYATNANYDTPGGPRQGSVTVIYDPPTTTSYFAEGTTRPGFDPYICIQNPGEQKAEVKITYMLGDSTTREKTLSVDPHSRSTVYCRDTLGTADDAAHDFSAKVECTNGQTIVAERPTYFNYKGIYRGGHDVVGSAPTALDLYFAEGTCRPGFDAYVCLQDYSQDAARADITFRKGDGTEAEKDTDVPPRTRSTVYAPDVLGTADDAAHDFSALVDTDNMGIIAERPTYFNYHGWAGGSDTMATTTLASTLYFAEGTTRPGFDTYITIGNMQALSQSDPGYNVPAEVDITYMRGDGTTTLQHVSVPYLSRATVHPADVLGIADDAAHDFSAKVECTNARLGIVAERPTYFSYKGTWAGGHTVMGTPCPGSTFYFAEGTCRPGYDTYLCIQNPGGSEARVKVTYMRGDGTTAEQEVTVAAHSRKTLYPRELLGTGDDPSHDFSSKVECTNGQRIVVERPVYFNYKGAWDGGHNVMGLQR